MSDRQDLCARTWVCPVQLMFWNKRQVDFFFSVAVVSENDCNFNKPLKCHLTASELLQ